MLGKVGATRCALNRPHCVPATLTITGAPAQLDLCYKCAPSVKAAYESQGHVGLALVPLSVYRANQTAAVNDDHTAAPYTPGVTTARAHSCQLAQPDCAANTLRLRDFRDNSFELWVCVTCFTDVVYLLREQGRWVRVGEASNIPDERWVK